MNFFKNLKLKPKPKITNEHIRMDLRGEQIKDKKDVFNQHTFQQDVLDSAGPHMLSSKTRFKIWLNLAAFLLYCYGLSKLMLYRLKSDDLEIMEREVKEEFEIKRKVKELEKV